MELIDQLEKRIDALLADRDRLARETVDLREAQARNLATLADENRRLKETLEQERAGSSEAVRRIEVLVERLRARTDQE